VTLAPLSVPALLMEGFLGLHEKNILAYDFGGLDSRRLVRWNTLEPLLE